MAGIRGKREGGEARIIPLSPPLSFGERGGGRKSRQMPL